MMARSLLFATHLLLVSAVIGSAIQVQISEDVLACPSFSTVDTSESKNHADAADVIPDASLTTLQSQVIDTVGTNMIKSHADIAGESVTSLNMNQGQKVGTSMRNGNGAPIESYTGNVAHTRVSNSTVGHSHKDAHAKIGSDSKGNSHKNTGIYGNANTLTTVTRTRGLYSAPTGSKSSPVQVSSRPAINGPRNGVYFANWSAHEKGLFPQDMPSQQITHLFYAFADVGVDGTVYVFAWAGFSPSWVRKKQALIEKLIGRVCSKSSNVQADLEHRYNRDPSGKHEGDSNAYGCVKQLYIQKKRNRKLKTILSIGGWTYSKQGKFTQMADTEAGRKTFASSAVKLMSDWGMDGLDVDWESLESHREAQLLVELLRECRQALDQYAERHGQHYHYLLTMATPVFPGIMNLTGMDALLDGWNLMAYDYAGSWETTTGHHANLYPDRDHPARTKASTKQGVTEYLASGILPSKIAIGLPLYGRSFAHTQGLGMKFNGSGAGTDPESGTWLYRDLPRPGADVEFDPKTGAAFSYDGQTRELVSYDTVESTLAKARYILSNSLGGAFFWEASGDKKGPESLVDIMGQALGPLDDTLNMLDYPSSRYVNIRNKMANV